LGAATPFPLGAVARKGGFIQAIGTWTKMNCEQSVNGTFKLVYIATNTWAVVRYLYDDGFGIMYPTFLP
jgi:ABC-type enterochelin transport system permease subunit